MTNLFLKGQSVISGENWITQHFKSKFLDNKQNVTTYNIPVEETNVPQGHCTNGTSDETISVEWAAQTQNVTNTFAYTFGLKDDNIKYYLKKATYTIFAGDLYNGNNDTLNLIYNGSEYATPKGYSYHCTKEQQLNLTDKSNKSVGSVHVSHVQLQAFYSSKTGNFTTAKDCDYPETPGKLFWMKFFLFFSDEETNSNSLFILQ